MDYWKKQRKTQRQNKVFTKVMNFIGIAILITIVYYLMQAGIKNEW